MLGLATFTLLFLLLSQLVHGQLNGFDEYVTKAMRDWEVPGIAIAVIKDDKIVLAKGYGVRQLGAEAPVDERTLFAIGSSSKAFTAAGLAMLVDEGKIKWDDPAVKHLPGFEMFDPYVTRELRIRDLLTHRSGLERGDFLWYGSELDRDEILRRTRYLKPTWSLRSNFGYQNLMYLAAGQVAAKATGKSWDEFIKSRIFTPLGMTASNTSIKDFKNGDNVATPHASVEDKVQPIAWRNIDNIAPAGSINSNVLDMAQWVRLQLGQGTFEGKKLISPAAMREMHMPQTVMRLEGAYTMFYPEAHFLTYGLGWFMHDYKGKKVVEHGGAIDGMRAGVAMIPEEKLGVVILTNMNGSLLPIPLMFKVFDAYLGGTQKDWSADMLKALKPLQEQGKAAEKKAESERVMGTNPSLALEKYAGTYKNDLYGEVKINNEGGKLNINFGPAFKSDLQHWHYDTFRAQFNGPVASKVLVAFGLNPQGKADTVTLGLFSDYPFKRVPDPPLAKAAQ
ncbi:MAG TPA: serine hydrolase [Pyrinomonadaceae bacterium]|nr:serine hydrolase [Pyrinomonadaceae bacterium]